LRRAGKPWTIPLPEKCKTFDHVARLGSEFQFPLPEELSSFHASSATSTALNYLLSIIACADPQRGQNGRSTMSTQVIDLTLTAYHGMRGVEISPNTSIENEGFNTTHLRLYSHAGTHADAPRHFLPDGRTLEAVDLNKCVGPALVIDVTHKTPNSLITVEDLGDRAQEVEPGSRVLLASGWDAHAELADYRTDFPRISRELARWLVGRGVWLVGVEMPSVAALSDRAELTEVHQILLRGEVVIVECLTRLRELPSEVFFIALPLKIQGGDGSPVRAVAVLGPKPSD
jgi:kynurenine formamidase